jgi:predicted nuclease of predicted toxin-antitoxin system
MKIVIDMNLSPDWVDVLQSGGHEVVHWSMIGAANADDSEIMVWARTHGYIVFTTDLDFGAILVASGQSGPSVIQLRLGRHFPSDLREILFRAIIESRGALDSGALLTIDQKRFRLRILSIRDPN